MIPELYFEVAIIAAAIFGALVFLAAYPALAPVRRWTQEGWHLWTFTLALTSLGCASLARRIFPDVVDSPIYTTVLLLTYATLAGMIWWRVGLLFGAARRDAGAPHA